MCSKLVPIAKKVHDVGLVFVFCGSIDLTLPAAMAVIATCRTVSIDTAQKGDLLLL